MTTEEARFEMGEEEWAEIQQAQRNLRGADADLPDFAYRTTEREE